MDSLLIQFRDNGRLHDDIHLWLEGYSRRADSYYLSLDDTTLASTESAIKVRRVLIQLLMKWSEAVAQATGGRPAHLPYDFSDEFTGCLRCHPDGEDLEIVPGFSWREGWSVFPSDPGDYFFGVADFEPDPPRRVFAVSEFPNERSPLIIPASDFQRIEPSTLRLPKGEFLRRIQESIADAESQLGATEENLD